MRPPFRTLSGLLLSFVICLSAGRAFGQTLGIASSAPVTSIDPHYHTFAPNESFSAHVFERLVTRDAAGDMIPGLAVSWKLRDDHTWEFRLRDVKFHDGTPFTAEDVAYTLNRVPKVKNSPASYSIYTKAVIGTEIVDPHTILLRTDGPYPLLANDLGNIFIIPHTLGPDPATEDFNSGKDAIGTGPYRFVSYSPGDRIEMERNDDYWGPKPVLETRHIPDHQQRRLAYRRVAGRRCRDHRVRAADRSPGAAQGSARDVVGSGQQPFDFPLAGSRA